MDVKRCLENVDALFKYKKIDEVEPYLISCVEMAIAEDDSQAVLTFLNELVGYYRSVSRHDDALLMASQARALYERMNVSGGVSEAVMLINEATAYRAANRAKESLPLYERALEILDCFDISEVRYEKASLFNNMSLAYKALGDFQKALDTLLTAVSLLDNPSIEMAISLVNIAGCYYQLERYQLGFKTSSEAVKMFSDLTATTDNHYGFALASLATGYYYFRDYVSAAKINQQALQQVLISYGTNDDYLALVEKQKTYLTLSNQVDALKAFMEKEPSQLKGLELAKAYYDYYGKSGLAKQFSEIVDLLAIGLVGEGSECLGLDDDISQDHDFGPGFCIFIPKKLADQYALPLQAFYDQLPKTFMGKQRQATKHGKKRVGVIVIEDFFTKLTGCPYGPKTFFEWLQADENGLLSASNGEIFADPSGYFSTIYQSIQNYYPDGVYKTKLSLTLTLMAQSGQYQYPRCLKRKDEHAALLYVNEFINNTLQCLFLLNQQYMPYTKWQFKMAEQLPKGHEILALVKKLQLERDHQNRIALIENICGLVTEWLNRKGLTTSEDTYLEMQAEELLKGVRQ